MSDTKQTKGPGRPRVDNPRERIIGITCTQAEHDAIAAKAAEQGLTIAGYGRIMLGLDRGTKSA